MPITGNDLLHPVINGHKASDPLSELGVNLDWLYRGMGREEGRDGWMRGAEG